MAAIPTVKIESKDSASGYMIINQADLTKTHTLFVEKKKTQKWKDVDKSAKRKDAKNEK